MQRIPPTLSLQNLNIYFLKIFFVLFNVLESQSKVLDQFLHHPIDTRDDLLEAYMVGQRLVKFLSIILPTHLEYSNHTDIRAKAARERSLEQLAVVTKYIDQIALLIDKQEHEDYISLVINQHHDEKSTKSRDADLQKREDMYYTDDTEDDVERNSTYLATSNTRGSDSTERLNNVSTGSFNTQIVSNRTEPRYPLHKPNARSKQNKQSYQQNANDSSVVSDSVDVLYDNSNSISRDNIVTEDPVSTASHTILRVVSPYHDVPESIERTDAPTEKNLLTGNVSMKEHIVDKANETFSSNSESYEGMKSQTEMPTSRSNWVPVNRSTNINSLQKQGDTSFSSIDRSFESNTGSVAMNSNSVSPASMYPSPGGSVRNIIRSWPPKQDPPGDPPGKNVTALRAGAAETRSIKHGTMEPSSIVEPVISKVTVVSPSTEAETVTLQFKPMTDLQVMAAEFDKASPSREKTNANKMTSSTKFLPRRDPSTGSQHTRFSSTSYSPTSCEQSVVGESVSVPSVSYVRESNVVSPDSDKPKVKECQIASSTDFPSNKPEKRNCLNVPSSSISNEHNVSLDSIGFPKVRHSVSSDSTGPDTSLEARIMSIASNAAKSLSLNEGKRDVSAEHRYTSKTSKSELGRFSSNGDSFDFPVQFESRETSPKMINGHQDKLSNRELLISTTEGNLSSNQAHVASLSNAKPQKTHKSRQAGPVDLDDSTSSQGTTTADNNVNSVNVVSRGFVTDGLDYVLPLPKVPKGVSLENKTTTSLGSYAPPAVDWSLDDETEVSNRRLTRENSTISIDSTEFSAQPETRSEHRHFAEFHDPQDHVFGNSTDWTPVWSPQDFDSVLASDKCKEKTTDQSNASNSFTGRPDLSFEAWDQSWNVAANKKKGSHSSDTRKEIIAKGTGVHKGEYCRDRTSSTGSSSSTSRSRDVHQELGSSAQASALHVPFSSRYPIETPFLRDEKESPLMIDSMTEQRLRSPVKRNDNFPKHSNSISLPPHNVGLYGSLKGFQSLDCVLPFNHDSVDQNAEHNRGNILLCRSRAANLTHHRSPNEDDWEESSLLMVESQKDEPKFKSCVRCLLK